MARIGIAFALPVLVPRIFAQALLSGGPILCRGIPTCLPQNGPRLSGSQWQRDEDHTVPAFAMRPLPFQPCCPFQPGLCIAKDERGRAAAKRKSNNRQYQLDTTLFMYLKVSTTHTCTLSFLLGRNDKFRFFYTWDNF